MAMGQKYRVPQKTLLVKGQNEEIPIGLLVPRGFLRCFLGVFLYVFWLFLYVFRVFFPLKPSPKTEVRVSPGQSDVITTVVGGLGQAVGVAWWGGSVEVLKSVSFFFFPDVSFLFILQVSFFEFSRSLSFIIVLCYTTIHLFEGL